MVEAFPPNLSFGGNGGRHEIRVEVDPNQHQASSIKHQAGADHDRYEVVMKMMSPGVLAAFDRR
jgi:hypothetical protein